MKGTHGCMCSVVGGKLVLGTGHIAHTPLQRTVDGSRTFWINLIKAAHNLNNFLTLTLDIYHVG